MQNIAARTRYEFGEITARPTAARIVTVSSNIPFTDFSGMLLTDIYESAPIDILESGKYCLYLYTYEYIYGAQANVNILDDSTGTTLASIGSIDLFSYTGAIVLKIRKLNTFVLADPVRIRIQIDITGHYAGSAGYNITIGDMVIYKEK